jgi:hypothetical protein
MTVVEAFRRHAGDGRGTEPAFRDVRSLRYGPEGGYSYAVATLDRMRQGRSSEPLEGAFIFDIPGSSDDAPYRNHAYSLIAGLI